MFADLWCLLLFLGFQGDTTIQETLRIEYVLIDLIALDKDNQPISDLRAQDFVVKDQGRKVALESFQVLDFSQQELTTDGFQPERLDPQRIQARQQFIFCLDLEDLTLTQLKKTFSQVRRAIKETALPKNADYLLFSLNYGQLTPGFVTDRDKLLTHLTLFEDRLHEKKLRARRAANGGEDEFILDIPDPRQKPKGRAVGVPHRPPGQPGSVNHFRQPQKSGLDRIREEEELRLLAKLGLLESLATKFKDVPGLKTIFFISPGFSLSPGSVAIQEHRRRAAKSFSRRTGSNPLNSGPLESMLTPHSRPMHEEFEKVIHTCTRNRVVFHSLNIYLTALETSAMFAGRPAHIADSNDRAFFAKENLREQHKGLERLSTLSGGMVSRGADLQATLETWLPRLNYVYLLGYTSPEGNTRSYRKIKIKCKRKKTTLHYRRGYVSGP